MRQLRGRSVVALVALLAVTACGDDVGGSQTVTSPTSALATSPTTDVAPITGAAPASARLIVLGEDFLLADVLALGFRPIAATATLDDGFTGIDADTSGIEPLSATDPNLEQLAGFDADRIVATAFVADQVGAERLASIAPTTVLVDDDWRAALLDLATELDATERGEELLARYDAAVVAGRAALPDGLLASLATVYPGPSLAVWVDGPTNIPQTLLDLGVELEPGPGRYDDERQGRVFLSGELVGELSAPLLILSQTSAVEGEDAALAELSADALWLGLPAVETGNVVTVDRLGYPGVEGRIGLIDELVSALG